MTFPIVAANGPSGYNLTRSIRLRSSASASLSRTFGSPTNNKIWTISVWAKRGKIGSRNFIAGTNTTGGVNAFYFDWDSDALEFGEYTSSWQWRLVTSQVFRDPSAWYHIVVAVDTTQATASNRVKMYVNGSQVTAFSTASYPTQNLNTYWNQSGQAARFGELNGASLYYDGYLAEINFIDGQALTQSSFGSTNALTGVWQPIQYSGTYGANGFELQFTDNSALTTSSNVGLGKDFSGNGNYWTTNNISITAGVTYDSMTDVPTLTSATAANFCVVNPLNQVGATITGGNLNVEFYAGTSGATATFGMPSGKWYWETTIQQIGTSCGIGIVNDAGAGQLGSGSGYGQGAGSWVYREDGNKRTNSSSSSYGASYTTGDVIGVAFDADTDTLTFYKNGTSQGTAFTGLTATTYYPVFGASIATNNIQNVNFGQRPFAYTPPTGYVALNTYNLPNSTIVKGNTVMDATLYTGNGTNQTITNAGAFKPDLVWVKCRSLGYGNYLEDSVRGVGKDLSSNSTGAEATFNLLTSFNSNGFTVSTSSGTYLASNDSGQTFVGWQWQAGQGTTSTNTSGSITSTVSVNVTAGFSVVTFTAPSGGATAYTIGHSLGVAPSLVISKERNAAGIWSVYHVSSGATRLQLQDSGSGTSSVWTTLPTSSTFWLPSSYSDGNQRVAYCFAAIAGYSAFGSYTGNGSTDGPFVYLGFRPKFVIVKNFSASENWYILDSSRDTYNPEGNFLSANLNLGESSPVTFFDFLSNGIKIRNSGGYVNSSGATYIYIAFAENPFKNALAR